MLKLVNIKNNSSTIEADFIPESSNLKAHISLDKSTEEYESETLDDYGSKYERMAANGLIRTLKELMSGEIVEVPKERLVMWY